MKMLSLFSGIGAFEKALDNLGIDYELISYCEIDKYASKSYSMVRGVSEDKNLWDITKIDFTKLPKVDLVTYGFPCQDISLAGKQKGFSDENGELTRSGLFFYASDVIKATQPKFAIFENVKNLVSKKFKNEFDTVLKTLDELGYNTYWKVLNAKEFGIPQNRERVFGISIRKDIDHGFEFPQGFELKLRLKDLLEENVDDKYYLSETVQKRFKFTDTTLTKNVIGTTAPEFRTIGERDLVYKENGIMGCLTATDYKQPKQILESKRLGACFDDEKGKHQAGSVWDTDGLFPTLDTMQGGYRQPCVLVPEATKKGYAEAYIGDGVYVNRPHQKRGCVQKGMIQTLKTSCSDMGVVVEDKGSIYLRNFGSKGKLQDTNDTCATLKAAMGSGGGNVPIIDTQLSIRKLTPRESWRLMGFTDTDFDKVQGISDTQLYKQAGNSIVVDVLYYLFKNLFEQYGE